MSDKDYNERSIELAALLTGKKPEPYPTFFGDSLAPVKCPVADCPNRYECTCDRCAEAPSHGQ